MKRIDNRFSYHVTTETTGFYFAFVFRMLDTKTNTEIHQEKYSTLFGSIRTNYEDRIKKLRQKSEKDFLKKAKKIIDYIHAVEEYTEDS